MVDYNKIQSKVPVDIFPHLVSAMSRFEINTEFRVSHFVSQCMHESNNFKATSENLNYSAQGLRGTFPKYFPDDAIANAYARQPEKIANHVYCNRNGNAGEESGDGWKFRGRGLIQLTFKDNYISFASAIKENVFESPDLLDTPKYASLSACWFFYKNGLNLIADKGATDDVVKQITKIINGGYAGLSDRIKKFHEINQLFLTS